MRPWGSIKLDIYGGSHEKRMGLTMELPKGLRLDGEIISRDIERRRGVSKKGVISGRRPTFQYTFPACAAA